MDIKLFSPVSGRLIPIENVDDPVFADKLMGDGAAVRPQAVFQDILAPVDGEVANISDTLHAVIISSGGYDILMHIGIDTVKLKGEGFRGYVKNGDMVRRGQKLIGADFAAIESRVPSIDVITVVTNLEDGDSLRKADKEELTPEDEMFTIVPAGGAAMVQEEAVNAVEKISAPVQIVNADGIHARPALVITEIANKYESVKIKKGSQLANAKSIASLMGLNIKFMDEIQIIAKGKGAEVAVSELIEAVTSGLGEAAAGIAAEEPEEPVLDFTGTVELGGILASPGFAIAKSFVYSHDEIEVPENAADAAEEARKLDAAADSVRRSLNEEIRDAETKGTSTKAEIYKAHLGILGDECIVEEAKTLISEGKSAAYAWRKATEDNTKALSQIDNPLFKERLADFKDVERRVIKVILGQDDGGSFMCAGNIIIADDLVPSDLVKLENAAGYVLAGGSATSHVSLIIRNMGVPCLVNAGRQVLNIPDGVDIILDATGCKITVNPGREYVEEIREKQRKLEIIQKENMKNASEPAITTDGLSISVQGNISNSGEGRRAYELGARGIGLFRTEFLFLNSSTVPDAETHRTLYQQVIDAMPEGKITIRMLDVGGDKQISYVRGTDGEENPTMGFRGVRNYALNIDVIRAQVQGILQVKPLSRVKIMIPMVADIAEFLGVRELINDEKARLGIKEEVDTGTMVEVPSLALIADSMGKYADFFSIGTNDLSQYTMAMDRGNKRLAGKLDNMHPAVLKLIKLTADGAVKNSIPIAVCGAMASEPASVPLLIGLGVRELSVSMSSIADIKALIRSLNAERCKNIALQALEMASAAEVREFVHQKFGNLL